LAALSHSEVDCRERLREIVCRAAGIEQLAAGELVT
jgi:hypothetical protein